MRLLTILLLIQILVYSGLTTAIDMDLGRERPADSFSCSAHMALSGQNHPIMEADLSSSVFYELLSKREDSNQFLKLLFDRANEVNEFSDVDLYFLIRHMPRTRNWGAKTVAPTPPDTPAVTKPTEDRTSNRAGLSGLIGRMTGRPAASPIEDSESETETTEPADPPQPLESDADKRERQRAISIYQKFVKRFYIPATGFEWVTSTWIAYDHLILMRVVSGISRVTSRELFLQSIPLLINITQMSRYLNGKYWNVKRSTSDAFRFALATIVHKSIPSKGHVTLALPYPAAPIVIDGSELHPVLLDRANGPFREGLKTTERIEAIDEFVQNAESLSESDAFVLLAALPRGVSWGHNKQEGEEMPAKVKSFYSLINQYADASYSAGNFTSIDGRIILQSLAKVSTYHHPGLAESLFLNSADAMAYSSEYSSSSRNFRIDLIEAIRAIITSTMQKQGTLMLPIETPMEDLMARLDTIAARVESADIAETNDRLREIKARAGKASVTGLAIGL
ncbi:MAG: hypothetical protein AAF202_01420 [Pseudomonadota bacterium]